jgi:ZIP family zinc transporter
VPNAGEALVWGLAVGGSLVAGAVAAAAIALPARAAATLTAFGGGVLLAAVALELVPEADAGAGAGLTAAGLLAGTLVYVAADRRLTRDEDSMMMRRSAHAAAAGRDMRMPADMSEASRGEAIAAGLFVDGVPESIALGLTVAESEIGVALLAGILVGNLVEAYGAAQPIIAGGRTRRFAIGLLSAIGGALAVAVLLGGTRSPTRPPSLSGRHRPSPREPSSPSYRSRSCRMPSPRCRASSRPRRCSASSVGTC